MVKQRCLRFNKNNTYTEKDFDVQEGKIQDDENRQVEFNPNSVFPPARESTSGLRFYRKFLFWRALRHKPELVFFIEGLTRALTWQEIKAGLQIYWSQKESSEFVKKAIAIEAFNVKPLKTWQFAVIMILLLAILVCCVRILQLWAV